VFGIVDYLSDDEKKKFSSSNTVYHYCSCDAFIKIISNREIWLTHSSFMNDYKELKYFDELVIATGLNKGRKKNLIKEYEKRIKSADLNSYIFCTSYGRDVLNNWVKYGDNGKGFAIGFNKESFNFTGDDKIPSIFDNPSLALSPVKYIDKNEQIFVENIISMFDKSIKAEKDSFHRNYTVMPGLVDELLLLRNFVKNKYFEDEQECRLLLHKDSAKGGYPTYKSVTGKLSYRARSDCIVPYYPIKLDSECFVKEIVIGPKNCSRVEDVRNFVSKYFSGNEIKVNHSDISYI
jgi:hypothetical protein